MKITLVISSLSCGGAERVLVSMAKGFIEHNHDVTIITLSDKTTDFYQIPSGCTRIALDIMGVSPGILVAIKNNIQRVTILRQAIKSSTPDVVISFLRITNITAILALAGTKYPLIVTEHNDIRVFSYSIFWETLRRLTYPFCAKVVSVSQGVDNGFTSLPKSKRAVIYNPIIVNDNGQIDDLPAAVDYNKNWLVSMGRLTEQKGFELLLQAFHDIAHQYPDWQLLILGRGELRQKLEQLKDSLGLGTQVVFTGALNNPFRILKQAKLFVMTSLNEGFPMAHGEALACGLPVIATDCPSGPREMIRHDIDGLLVPNRDVAAITAAIISLITDETKRQQLAARAPEIEARFGLEAIVTEWEVLMQEVIREKN